VAVSETPIGIDIEAIRPFNEGLMRKTMNSEEQTYILSSLNPEIEFIRLWTQKEAYVKMQGTGIIADMHDILCNATNVHW
jgi:4'-phosphopantetheinyl transferase